MSDNRLTVAELLKMLQEFDPLTKVEFVVGGNHFTCEGALLYKTEDYNAVELYGQQMTDIELYKSN